MKIAFSVQNRNENEKKRTSRPTYKSTRYTFNLQDCRCTHLDEITLKEETKNATAQQNRKKSSECNERPSKTISTEMAFKNILRQL